MLIAKTLAELIREGAQLHPQGRQWFEDADGRTCVLGAAQQAASGRASHFGVWE